MILLCNGSFKICGLKNTEDSGSGGGAYSVFQGQDNQMGAKIKTTKAPGILTKLRIKSHSEFPFLE